MKGVRAVLFDAGGTLIHLDGKRICGAAGLAYSAERFGAAELAAISRVRDELLRDPESTDAGRFPLFVDTMLTSLGVAGGGERARAAERIAEEHRRANLWSSPGAEAVETLETLHARGYRLGVVSNADGRVRRLLEDAGLSQRLDFILDSKEVGLEKPDPRIFLAATARLGLAPEECAYVGDIYEIDVAGAEAAGLQPILIGVGLAPEPVTRVESLAALLQIFRGEE